MTIGAPPPARQTFGTIMKDCLASAIALALLGSLFAGVMLNGLADTINTFGDFMRWAFG